MGISVYKHDKFPLNITIGNKQAILVSSTQLSTSPLGIEIEIWNTLDVCRPIYQILLHVLCSWVDLKCGESLKVTNWITCNVHISSLRYEHTT